MSMDLKFQSIQLNKTTRMLTRLMVVAMLVMASVMMKTSGYSIKQNCDFKNVPSVEIKPQKLNGVRYFLYFTKVPQSPPGVSVATTKLKFKYDKKADEINVKKVLITTGGDCLESTLTIDTTQASSGVLSMVKTVPSGDVYASTIYNFYADDNLWLYYTEVKKNGKRKLKQSFIRLSSTDPTVTLADLPSEAALLLSTWCGGDDPATILQQTTENLSDESCDKFLKSPKG